MDADFEGIRNDLERLRTSRFKPYVFGADSHKYILRPPLSESEVVLFERKHGIALPSDYRQFLIKVGNGGAGPYYGVFSLGEMDDGYGHALWKENDGLVGILSRPFPHLEPWNDLPDEPNYDEPNQEELERQVNAFDESYWNPQNVNGAIPICHLGCARRQWLVVTGPEAGHIWCDDRVDRCGLYPLSSPNSTRVTFFQWYRAWLDEAIRPFHKYAWYGD
jgi:hypothetical protein